MNSYNTQLENLILKEYGRNIQKLTQYVTSIEDKEKRNHYAQLLIDLMQQLNPELKDSADNLNKLWDDLFIISEFNLEVESPFPIPLKENLSKKPQKLDYSTNEIKFRHYGKNVEKLIKHCFEQETANDEEFFINLVGIGRMMKSFYLQWNKDNPESIMVLRHIEILSGKKISEEIKERILQENLLENFDRGNRNQFQTNRNNPKRPSKNNNNSRNSQRRGNDNKKRRPS